MFGSGVVVIVALFKIRRIIGVGHPTTIVVCEVQPPFTKKDLGSVPLFAVLQQRHGCRRMADVTVSDTCICQEPQRGVLEAGSCRKSGISLTM